MLHIFHNCFCMQGERILKLAEMCRKLETEEEKVLPFYASSLTQEENEDVEAAVMEAPSEPLATVSLFSFVFLPSNINVSMKLLFIYNFSLNVFLQFTGTQNLHVLFI